MDGKVEEYLKFLNNSSRWYRIHANKSMILYIVIRLVLTIVSASLPALAANVTDRDYLTVAAVTVAVLAALDTQFKWGDEWRQYRMTQLSLEQIERMYRQGALAPGLPEDKRFLELVEKAEALMARDAENFFSFRITAWKAP